MWKCAFSVQFFNKGVIRIQSLAICLNAPCRCDKVEIVLPSRNIARCSRIKSSEMISYTRRDFLPYVLYIAVPRLSRQHNAHIKVNAFARGTVIRDILARLSRLNANAFARGIVIRDIIAGFSRINVNAFARAIVFRDILARPSRIRDILARPSRI